MDISQISGTILFIAAFIELILALVFWFKGKSKAAFHFGWTVLFIAGYAFSHGGVYLFEQDKLLWRKATGVGNLIIPALVIFVYYFTGRTKYIKLKSFLWYLPGIIFAFLCLTTSYIVVDISPEFPYPITPGSLDPFSRAYIVIGLAVALFYLLKEYFKSKGFKRWQLKYFILAISAHTGAGIILAGIIPLLYPQFIYPATYIVAIFPIFTVGLITYAIFRRQLFGMRVILTEILVGTIGIILLIQALLAESLAAKVLGLITFFSFLLVGYLLIRVTQKEIQRKEQAESLAKQLKHLNETLEDRVKGRTKELEKSYQEIKKRKDELEKFYNLTVGRELRMVELKEQIKEFKKKLGEDKTF